MLVLSRRSKQSIKIGDDIGVTILDVKGKRITIGIEAPNQVQIRRAELEGPTKVDSDACKSSPRLESCAGSLPVDLTTLLVSE